MCRNIKVLFNFKPAATPNEIQAAAEQYVRKISGFHKPSKANLAAYNQAIEAVKKATTKLLNSLTTDAYPRNRETEAEKAHARAIARFGP